MANRMQRRRSKKADADKAAVVSKPNRPHHNPAAEPPQSQLPTDIADITVAPPIRGPPHVTLLSRKAVLARVGVTYPALWVWMRRGL
jgi:hypothetical protein